jgi:hypothetical protein
MAHLRVREKTGRVLYPWRSPLTGLMRVFWVPKVGSSWTTRYCGAASVGQSM